MATRKKDARAGSKWIVITSRKQLEKLGPYTRALETRNGVLRVKLYSARGQARIRGAMQRLRGSP
jgi:hypothetical protein